MIGWMLDAGYWILDTGCWILVEDPNFRRDAGYLKLENRYLMFPFQPSTRNPQQSPEVGGQKSENECPVLKA